MGNAADMRVRRPTVNIIDMDVLVLKIMVPILTAFSGALISWVFNRHRFKREDEKLDKTTEAQHITNIDAATKTWQKVVDALEKQVGKLLEQRQLDSDQIVKLSKEVNELRGQVETLQRKLVNQAEYQAKIEHYEKLLDAHGIAY